MSKWQKTSQGNLVLDCGDFFISYNSFTDELISNIPFFSSDDENSETALVRGRCFYILNGDYRSEYEKLVKEGWGACIKFFDGLPEKQSSWSNQ